MKNFANIILLFPLLLYVILLLINNDLLTEKDNLNIFWITSVELPMITIISLFFVLYLFIIYFSWKFSSFFVNNHNKNLEEEKMVLKSKLADQIPELNKKVTEEFGKILDEFQSISNKNLELHKNQTKQVLENLDFEIKSIKEKLDKLIK